MARSAQSWTPGLSISIRDVQLCAHRVDARRRSGCDYIPARTAAWVRDAERELIYWQTASTTSSASKRSVVLRRKVWGYRLVIPAAKDRLCHTYCSWCID